MEAGQCDPKQEGTGAGVGWKETWTRQASPRPKAPLQGGTVTPAGHGAAGRGQRARHCLPAAGSEG